MCFYNDDYYWTAEVVEDSLGVLEHSGKPTECMECGKKLQPGDWRHTVHMEQYAECPRCEENEDWGITGDEAIHECTVGETYDYVRCLDCEHLLDCVVDVEIQEGCPPAARKPAYEDLREAAFVESDSRFAYAQEAVDRYPELWSHPFIVDLLD